MSVKVESYNKKYLKMKPEVSRIFDDLDEWYSHCKWKLMKYDPADLYKSDSYKKFEKRKYSKNHK
jgi:hypothetical protein